MNVTSTMQIQPDATLRQLLDIKKEWIDDARGLAFPEKMWRVVSWLGTPVRTTHGAMKIWRASNDEFALVGREKETRFLSDVNAWQLSRQVTAWSGKFGADPALIDAVVLHCNRVACWRWTVIRSTTGQHPDEVFEEENHLLFIPGPWARHVVGASTEAENVARAERQRSTEAQRQILLSELLVGVNLG